ncbi:MAG: DMT family transporter [Eubacterium sp.]|nr:DMT family transporter [Eubacterium sp.]
MNKKYFGHLSAIITIIIWGTTFISTKLLLQSFKPIEILFFRFVIGFAALYIIYPKRLKSINFKQEITFAAAGICGITLYYLLENIALIYTTASAVGVIISTAPFFTAILSYFISRKQEKLSLSFFIGFAISMTGICLLSFENLSFDIRPFGNILALLSAFVWALYSVLSKKISGYGYNTIQSTRRIFLYGIVFMIPFLFIFDFKLELSRFSEMSSLMNMLFLGFGASALCFVTWNSAVKSLGAVKTSVYIYLVPVITVVASVLILNEKETIYSVFGICLTLLGLILSQIKKRGKIDECSK